MAHLMRIYCLLVLLLFTSTSGRAQWTDDFADGDVTASPSWSGETSSWSVVPFGDDFALRTDGPAATDTLHLVTQSTISHGTWRFTFAYTDGRLTNFNKVRVYLTTDATDLEGSVQGYHLELGTRSRDVVLVRSDREATSGRVELAASEEEVLPHEGDTVAVEVTRTAAHVWAVRLDGRTVLQFEEDAMGAISTSHFFGFWVKHSSTRNQSYFFDDVDVAGDGTIVDEGAPNLSDVRAVAPDTLAVTFDEPVTNACTADRYEISGGVGRPDDVVCDPPLATVFTVDEALLVLATAMMTGASYTLTVRDLEDRAGNVRPTTTVDFTFEAAPVAPAARDVVINEFNYAAFGADAEYVELYNRSEKTVDLARFALSDSRRVPVALSDDRYPFGPGEYVVLIRDSTAFADRFPGVASVAISNWPALNNGGDDVVLTYDETLVVDELAYAPDWGGSDAALERVDPAGPSSAALNWRTAQAPGGGTPGERNSVYAPDFEPPVVVSVTSSDAADSILVTFDEPLDPATVQTGDFTVSGPSTAAVVSSSVHGADVWLALDSPLAPGDYVLVIEDLADYAGNVLVRAEAEFVYFRGAVPVHRDVVINEIYYDTPTPGEPDEFVELYNRSEATFDLRDFAFADEDGDTVPLTDAPLPLGPGGYTVLVGDPEAFAGAFPGVNHVVLPDWHTLNNGGDVPQLLFGDLVVDGVPYESDWNDTERALERIDPDGPSDHRSNWAPSVSEAGATPGAQNSVHAPDEHPPRLVFAERTAPRELRVTFDEAVAAATAAPEAFDADGPPARTELLDGGDEVVLTFDAPVDAVTLSVEGIADLTGNVRHDASITIAVRPEDGDVVINEIMFAPATDSVEGRPPSPEYVELVSRADRLLSLRGTFIISSAGRPDTLLLARGAASLEAAAYAVVFAQRDPVDEPAKESQLARAFPNVSFGPGMLLPISSSDLGLLNGGETARLHGRDGMLLDAVPYDPDWHAPDLEDTRGVALERIDPVGSSAAPTNWSSSAAVAGGTPGEQNSIYTDAGSPPPAGELSAAPSPFSPDGDGFEDFTTLLYALRNAPASIRVRIFDQGGRLVRRLAPARLSGPEGRLTWDGRDDDGHRLRIGIYIVVLDAVGADDGATEAYRTPVVLARPFD